MNKKCHINSIFVYENGITDKKFLFCKNDMNGMSDDEIDDPLQHSIDYMGIDKIEKYEKMISQSEEIIEIDMDKVNIFWNTLIDFSTQFYQKHIGMNIHFIL